MKKGMTLIEVIVTALILAMGVTPLMYSFVVCKKLIVQNSHKVNATSIINQYFEGVQRRNNEYDLRTLIGSSDVSLPSFYPKSEYQYLGGNKIRKRYWLEFNINSVVTPDPSSNLFVVVARVSWDPTHIPVENWTPGSFSDPSSNSVYMVMYQNLPI